MADNGRSTGNNSKKLNLEKLIRIYGKTIDEESIKDVFKATNHDLILSINQLTKLTGIEVLEDPDFQPKTKSNNNNSANGKSESTSNDNNNTNNNSNYQYDASTSKLKINEIQGDLFSSNDSLCHCISRDVRMGKGIAVEFKKRFQGVDDLKGQNCKIGETAVLKRDNRFIYYLITKESYFNKPSYDDLTRSLYHMKSHMLKNGVHRLAMPKIGCGLDGLIWGSVKKILQDIFGDTDFVISVYSL